MTSIITAELDEIKQGYDPVASRSWSLNAKAYIDPKFVPLEKLARLTEDVENFNTDEICLSSVQVEEFCSLVFVNLDPSAASLASQSADLGKKIENYALDLGNLTFTHRLSYKIKANWKTVIDNFLGCYHCPTAHRDFVSLADMDTYQVTTHDIYSSHMAKDGLTENSAYAVDGASVTDHAVWFLWHNITLTRYPGRGNFMVWKIIPDGPEETREEFDFFFETDRPNEAEMEAIKYIDEVLQVEDIGLVESVQRGMRTPAFKQGRYVINHRQSGMIEHAVHHFHGMVLAAFELVANPEAARKDAISRHAVRRFGKPEDIANTALWLASNQSSFCERTNLHH